MFAFITSMLPSALTSILPSGLTTKLIAIGLAALLILGVVFAGYSYETNTRDKLVQQAAIAAQSQVKSDLAEKTSELVRQHARQNASELVTLTAKNEQIDQNADANAEMIDRAFPESNSVPEPAPITKDESHVAVKPAQPTSSLVATFAAINATSDATDRMLERASAATHIRQR